MQYQYQMRPNLYMANALNAFNSNQIGGGSGSSSKYNKMNVNVIVINIALVYGIASLYYILMTSNRVNISFDNKI